MANQQENQPRNKGVRETAKQAKRDKALVSRKLKRGMTHEEIVDEAKKKDADKFGAEASEKPVELEEKVESYYAAQARKEIALANLRELEYDELQKKVVDADAQAREWASVAQSIRDNLMAVPDRIGTDLPVSADIRRQVRDLLMREIRRVLAGLSDEIRLAA